jgi:hypothetical protein
LGAVVITPDQDTTHATDHWRLMTGSLHLSSSYAPGGDTFSPPSFGLALMKDLKVDSGAIVLQAFITNGVTGLLKAWWVGPVGVLVEVTPGTDLSSYAQRYMAYGW